MNAKTLISSICILLAICLAFYFYAEWQKQRFDAALPVPPPPPAQETGGHWHGDEWHTDDAHTGELIPGDDWPPNPLAAAFLQWCLWLDRRFFSATAMSSTHGSRRKGCPTKAALRCAGEPLHLCAELQRCRSVKLQK